MEDSISIHQEFEISNVCADIKKEIKEEKNVEVFTFNQQEIGNVSLS